MRSNLHQLQQLLSIWNLHDQNPSLKLKYKDQKTWNATWKYVIKTTPALTRGHSQDGQMTYRTKTVHLLAREELKNKSTTSSKNHIPYPQRTKKRSSRYLHIKHKSQRRIQITSLGWDEETMTARTEHKQQSHDFKLLHPCHKIPSPTLTTPREGNKSHRQSNRSGSPGSTEGRNSQI